MVSLLLPWQAERAQPSAQVQGKLHEHAHHLLLLCRFQKVDCPKVSCWGCERMCLLVSHSEQKRWGWAALAAVSAAQAPPQTLIRPDRAPLQQKRLGQAAVALSADLERRQALTYPVQAPLPQTHVAQATAEYSAAAAPLEGLTGLARRPPWQMRF